MAAGVAAEHAARHDRDGTFPEEGLAALAESGYLAAVVPERLGGEGATIASLVLGNLEVAKGDASLGLVVAMHAALLGRVRDAALWPEEVFGQVATEIASARGGRGAVINGLASEPEMGSPSRGALPRTRAERTEEGWQVSGRKTFSSGAPILRWGVVSAAVVEDGPPKRQANFLVPLDGQGVKVEPSWDALGMRATGSHTVVLEQVRVPREAELPRPQASPDGLPPVPHERAWSLVVAAVYLGVAEAARDEAVRFAGSRRPTALGGQSIGSLPHIRQRVGQMDLALYQARAALLGTARAWEERPTDMQRSMMEGALAGAKMTASNQAIAVVEMAMRLVGGSALDRSQPLERHFRDVRGGLYHPPQDDAAIEMLAHLALDGTL